MSHDTGAQCLVTNAHLAGKQGVGDAQPVHATQSSPTPVDPSAAHVTRSPAAMPLLHVLRVMF